MIEAFLQYSHLNKGPPPCVAMEDEIADLVDEFERSQGLRGHCLNLVRDCF